MLIKRRNIVILAIIIFMCSFLNIVNVKAATFENIMDYVSITNLYGLSYEEIIELGNSVGEDLTTLATNYEKWKESNPTDFFLFIPSSGGVAFIPNASKYNFSLYSEFLSYYYLGLRVNNSSGTVYFNYYNGVDFTRLYTSNGSSNITQYNQIRMQKIVYIFYISDIENINFSYSKHRDTGAHTYVEDDLIINGNNYSIGDELPISIETGYNSIRDYGPTLNSYSNSFDTINIDYIKVKLDVNDIIENEGSVEFDYSLNNYVLDGVANELPYPYIETIYLDTSEETNIDFMQYKTDTFDSYSDSMAVNLLQDLNTTVYYNFVIDTRNYNDILELNFNSYLGYEVVLYYSDGTTEIQYTTGAISSTDIYTPSTVTINLNDYEGIVLMPKVYSSTDSFAELYQHGIHYNQDYTVFLNGIYDIFVYTNPGNYVTLTDTYKFYENNYFTYNFGYVDFIDDKNTNYMKIVNVSSADVTDYTITIDTNMFTYSLIENITDNIIVDDANIPGEKINTGTVEESYKLYDANQSLSDVDSSIDKVTNFINDMKECMLIFSDLITFTFNSLNSYCQSFIIVTFIILVVVGIVLILRR